MTCSDEDREDMERSFRESLVTALQANGPSTEKREGKVGVADSGEGPVGVASKTTDRYDIAVGLLPSIVVFTLIQIFCETQMLKLLQKKYLKSQSQQLYVRCEETAHVHTNFLLFSSLSQGGSRPPASKSCSSRTQAWISFSSLFQGSSLLPAEVTSCCQGDATEGDHLALPPLLH